MSVHLLCPHMVEAEQSARPLVSFTIIRAPPSCPKYLSNAPSQNIITLWLGFWHIKLRSREMTRLQSTAQLSLPWFDVARTSDFQWVKGLRILADLSYLDCWPGVFLDRQAVPTVRGFAVAFQDMGGRGQAVLNLPHWGLSRTLHTYATRGQHLDARLYPQSGNNWPQVRLLPELARSSVCPTCCVAPLAPNIREDDYGKGGQEKITSPSILLLPCSLSHHSLQRSSHFELWCDTGIVYSINI